MKNVCTRLLEKPPEMLHLETLLALVLLGHLPGTRLTGSNHPSLSHSVQFSRSVISDSLRPHGLQHTRPPYHWHPEELAQTHVHRLSDAIQPSHPLSSPSPTLLLLPSVFPSISVFSNGSVLRIRWPKYWSFSFSISPSSEYSGLISFKIDWLDLLAVQGSLKSRL